MRRKEKEKGKWGKKWNIYRACNLCRFAKNLFSNHTKAEKLFTSSFYYYDQYHQQPCIGAGLKYVGHFQLHCHPPKLPPHCQMFV